MIISRDKYLRQLIAAKGNGMVKIVTGIRRSGKSFLLMTLFHQHLLEQGVPENHIIEISLDNRKSKHLRNPDTLLDYIDGKVQADGQTHYVILDEVQLVDDFVEVLLSLMQDKRLDVYVSGSNSKFLSKDVVTEFRGRGDEIHLYPLSFSEYYAAVGGDKRDAWKDYYTYGGLPQVLLTKDEEKKINYLTDLYELTYLKDIVERNRLRNVDGLRTLIRVLASGIGTPTNPRRIANTFQSAENVRMKDSTIRDYIGYLDNSCCSFAHPFIVLPAIAVNIRSFTPGFSRFSSSSRFFTYSLFVYPSAGQCFPATGRFILLANPIISASSIYRSGRITVIPVLSRNVTGEKV